MQPQYWLLPALWVQWQALLTLSASPHTRSTSSIPTYSNDSNTYISHCAFSISGH
ncbi:MAG: hypothetical protein HOP02_16345 [Methylococcaceae bacterium]|nr:hypothetical protein [Methylococcaceae bacterium]